MTTSNKTPKEAAAATAWAHKRTKLVITFAAAVALLIVYVVFFQKSELLQTRNSNTCSDQNMYIAAYNVQLNPKNKRRYQIEFARTPSQQEMGLSDRPCMPDDGALIFLFPTDDVFGIWMKNMHFAIDVLWLDQNKHVVHIEKNMQPESYPTVYKPSVDARYVVELVAGQADKLGADIGTTLRW